MYKLGIYIIWQIHFQVFFMIIKIKR